MVDDTECCMWQVRMVTFVVDDTEQSPILSSLGHMTCGERGILMTIPRSADLYMSMQPYFTFLKETSGPQQVVWTSPYLDKNGLGLMMTVSVPVINTRLKR